ncbi:hypothetical protein EVAR_12553_1 [Eumeta japonica]|uniref:Uncharacterized protein n=1 Tax=Eumeta variegata TaxID=151549 RepID=A0A4C1TPS0_EUMVA|nr:hypothetical protein EVAR_12553_1 [Eumeta japonica]
MRRCAIKGGEPDASELTSQLLTGGAARPTTDSRRCPLLRGEEGDYACAVTPIQPMPPKVSVYDPKRKTMPNFKSIRYSFGDLVMIPSIDSPSLGSDRKHKREVVFYSIFMLRSARGNESGRPLGARRNAARVSARAPPAASLPAIGFINRAMPPLIISRFYDHSKNCYRKAKMSEHTFAFTSSAEPLLGLQKRNRSCRRVTDRHYRKPRGCLLHTIINPVKNQSRDPAEIRAARGQPRTKYGRLTTFATATPPGVTDDSFAFGSSGILYAARQHANEATSPGANGKLGQN